MTSGRRCMRALAAQESAAAARRRAQPAVAAAEEKKSCGLSVQAVWQRKTGGAAAAGAMHQRVRAAGGARATWRRRRFAARCGHARPRRASGRPYTMDSLGRMILLLLLRLARRGGAARGQHVAARVRVHRANRGCQAPAFAGVKDVALWYGGHLLLPLLGARCTAFRRRRLEAPPQARSQFLSIIESSAMS